MITRKINIKEFVQIRVYSLMVIFLFAIVTGFFIGKDAYSNPVIERLIIVPIEQIYNHLLGRENDRGKGW